jgi:hypothetical protein
VVASGTVPDQTPRTYSFDLTGYVRQQLAGGANQVSIAIGGTVDTTELAAFNSRHASSGMPQLVVTQ